MLSTAIPAKFPIPFANGAGSGYVRTIPQASQTLITPGAASLTDGFPPLNFISEGAGGIPPFGQDVNGILKEITAWIQWMNAEGPVGYDSVFSAAIGGYPKGAILTSAAGGSWWLSTTENNVTDPDTGGAGWLYLSYGQTHAGNPNGAVAGVAAANGALASSLLWDTTNLVLWVCTTTGTNLTAAWTLSMPMMESFWLGTSTGTGNAQILATSGMVAFPTGTGIVWEVGASQSNTSATNITIGPFGSFPVVRDTPLGPKPLNGGELVAGNIADGRFDGASIHLTVRTSPGLVQGSGITAGHLAAFTDTLGTVGDGGAIPASALPIIVSTSQTVSPGIYCADTSGGAITLTLSPTLGSAYIFIDAQNTWGTNSLTINGNGHNIGNNSTNVAATFPADVSDYQFTIEASSTYWRLV